MITPEGNHRLIFVKLCDSGWNPRGEPPSKFLEARGRSIEKAKSNRASKQSTQGVDEVKGSMKLCRGNKRRVPTEQK